MKRMAMMVAVALLVSTGVARAQESVSPAPASPVEGGKVIKAKSKAMNASGTVKSVGANSLVVTDTAGKDWTFSVDASTRVVAPKETVDVGTVSPAEGGKQMPAKPATGQETIEAASASPIEGGKVVPSKKTTIADVKEGQHVQVSYHSMDGRMHATLIRVM